MKANVIRIPESTSEMNIGHLPFFIKISNLVKENGVGFFEKMTGQEIADLATLFMQKPDGSFDRYTRLANLKLLYEIISSCGNHKERPIKKKYVIDGVTYLWQEDYSKQPVSFHRDISMCNFKEKPIDLLAFCYIEEGLIYNEMESKTKMIANPRSERAEVLRSAVSLEEYLTVSSFFLSNAAVFRPFLEAKKKQKSKQKNGIGKNP